MLGLTQVTVNLTEQQEKFLKLFAEKHYNGAPDNLYTVYPFHIVETQRYNYTPYSDDIAEYYTGEELVFTTDDDYECWFTDEIELVNDCYSNEECPIEIKSFEDLQYKDISGVDGEEYFIVNYNDYFEAYGISLKAMAWRKKYYEQVALFFVRDEAKRYMEYQKHNLNEPRVYTYSAGYSNNGDFTHFWDLLMTMGEQLNNQNEKKEATPKGCSLPNEGGYKATMNIDEKVIAIK